MKSKKKALENKTSPENKTASKPEKAKGIFSRINQVMEEFAEAAKAEAKKSEAKNSESTEEWPPKEKIVPDEYQAEVEEDIDMHWPPRKKELVLEKRELIEKVRDNQKKQEQIRKVINQEKQPVMSSVKGSKRCFNQKITRAKLRNAVIWSEILAPPVSLKED